jgi:hypothetical protein
MPTTAPLGDSFNPQVLAGVTPYSLGLVSVADVRGFNGRIASELRLTYSSFLAPQNHGMHETSLPRSVTSPGRLDRRYQLLKSPNGNYLQ